MPEPTNDSKPEAATEVVPQKDENTKSPAEVNNTDSDVKNTTYGAGAKSYSKGKWIIIYIVLGVVIYGLIYYFVLANNNSPYN